MMYRGHVHNGVVILDDSATFPEGTLVEVDLVAEDMGAALCDRL